MKDIFNILYLAIICLGAWGLMVIHFLFLMLSRLIDYVLWFTDKAIYQIGLELDKVNGKMMVHGKKG